MSKWGLQPRKLIHSKLLVHSHPLLRHKLHAQCFFQAKDEQKKMAFKSGVPQATRTSSLASMKDLLFFLCRDLSFFSNDVYEAHWSQEHPLAVSHKAKGDCTDALTVFLCWGRWTFYDHYHRRPQTCEVSLRLLLSLSGFASSKQILLNQPHSLKTATFSKGQLPRKKGLLYAVPLLFNLKGWAS